MIINEIEEYILKNYKRYFPEYGNKSAVISVRPLGQRSSYPIWEININYESSETIALIAKQCPYGQGFDEAENEFNNLQLCKKMNGERWLSPKPIDLFRARNLIIMERLYGVSFKDYYLSKNIFGKNKEKLTPALKQVGGWLAEFHKFYYDEDLEGYLYYISKVISNIEIWAKENKILNGIIKELLDEFRIKEFYKYIPMSKMHGDLGLANILVLDDGRVAVLDMSYDKTVPFYYDVGYFIATLSTVNPYPKYLLFDQFAINRFAKTFLESYGREFDMGILSNYCALIVLKQCRNQLTRAKNRFVQKIICKKCVKLVTHFINNIDYSKCLSY